MIGLKDLYRYNATTEIKFTLLKFVYSNFIFNLISKNFHLYKLCSVKHYFYSLY
jgi:hypothetical protein